jgi:hypothetical protein
VDAERNADPSRDRRPHFLLRQREGLLAMDILRTAKSEGEIRRSGSSLEMIILAG